MVGQTFIITWTIHHWIEPGFEFDKSCLDNHWTDEAVMIREKNWHKWNIFTSEPCWTIFSFPPTKPIYLHASPLFMNNKTTRVKNKRTSLSNQERSLQFSRVKRNSILKYMTLYYPTFSQESLGNNTVGIWKGIEFYGKHKLKYLIWILVWILFNRTSFCLSVR